MMIWLSTSLATLMSILALTSGQETIQQCTYDEKSCGCKTEKGYISLREYADKPLYVKDAVQGYEYHWNPCKDYTMGTVTAACIQHLPKTGDDFDCGLHKTAKSSVVQGNAVFQLDAGDGLRHATITCQCKKGAVDVFQFAEEYPAGTYDLTLTGKSCCPRAVLPSSGGSDGGLSGGSILLIVFLVVVVLYLAGGVAVQAGVRKARGKERMPNIEFWSALPGLIKDGFRFTFSCGSRSSYDSI